jgi:hypothetical protein
MIKYIVDIDSPKIVLDIMGRKKTFFYNEEVNEDIYTKTYPAYFKRIGIIKGYNHNLSTPTFIPDSINDFINKEQNRKNLKIREELQNTKNTKNVKNKSKKSLEVELEALFDKTDEDISSIDNKVENNEDYISIENHLDKQTEQEVYLGDD